MREYKTVADLKKCQSDIIIFGTGEVGKEAIDIFQKNDIKIACLCDNDVAKQGTKYNNLDILSFDNILNRYENPIFIVCILSNAIHVVEQIENIPNIHYYVLSCIHTLDIENLLLVSKDHVAKDREKMAKDKEFIKQFKDKHKGERCFIIGNGPSLKAEDLDKLKNEYTFASNFIFKINDQTDWRPSYYTTNDPWFCNSISKKNISQIIAEYKFLFTQIAQNQNLIFEFTFIEYNNPIRNSIDVNISLDMSKKAFAVRTITYFNIQLALYMGFAEIILLGIDHNYSKIKINHSDEIINTDCKKDHFYDDKNIYNVTDKDYGMLHYSELGYKKAKEHCDDNNIKILNATRGGKLEIFDRVEFDTLF